MKFSFAILLLAIFWTKYIPQVGIDLAATRALQNIQNPFFDTLMRVVSDAGELPYIGLLVVFGALVLYLVRLKAESLTAIILPTAAALTGIVLKIIINRPRPDSSLISIYKIYSDKSFPSLHVFVYTVFFWLSFVCFCHQNQKSVA